jgi:rubrerythrin
MFIQLAKEELDHFTLFEEHRKNYLKNEIIEVKYDPSVILDLVPKISKNTIKRQGESGINQLNALQDSYEQEIKNSKFYEEQRDKFKKKEIRNLFQWLSEVEQSHAELILSQIDSIEKTGFWFDMMDFNLEAE